MSEQEEIANIRNQAIDNALNQNQKMFKPMASHKGSEPVIQITHHINDDALTVVELTRQLATQKKLLKELLDTIKQDMSVYKLNGLTDLIKRAEEFLENGKIMRRKQMCIEDEIQIDELKKQLATQREVIENLKAEIKELLAICGGRK